MMLDYLGEGEAARRVERTLRGVYREAQQTQDVGGGATTEGFAATVIPALDRVGGLTRTLVRGLPISSA